MGEHFSDILALVVTVAAAVSASFAMGLGATRYVLRRIEAEHNDRERADQQLHDRIAELRDSTVRKDDFLHELRRVEQETARLEAHMTRAQESNTQQHAEIQKTFFDGLGRVHARLDYLIHGRAPAPAPCAPAAME